MSPRWVPGLGSARWLVRCEWSSDNGASWTPCTYVDGSVSADATQQTRWSCSGLQVRDLPVGRGAFVPFSSWLRLFVGMVHSPSDVEWCPLGVFLAGQVDRSLLSLRQQQQLPGESGDLWTVTGKSLEQLVIDDRFPAPRSFPAQAASVLGPALVRQSVKGASVLWLADDVQLPGITEERDRWGVIDGRADSPSIAKSLGARCFCDARGVFIFAAESSLADEPVYTFAAGEGGNLVELAESIDSESTYNAISVSGVSNDPKKPPVGPVFWADTDETSPSWIGLRRKTVFYSSPKIRTVAQANKVAAAQLGRRLGLNQQVTLSAAYNPALEVGDVVLATMPDLSVQRHVIDQVTYDPRGGVMQVGTRSARTALAGQPVDAADLLGDDEDTGGGADGA